MSYINDALHKVQKEKESPYASYGGILVPEGKKPGQSRRWILRAGLIVILFAAAGLVAMLYWPDVPETPRAVALVQSSAVATAQPVLRVSAEALKTPSSGPKASSEAALPFPAQDVKTPVTWAADVEERKQNAVIPATMIQSEASPRPDPADPASLYAQALQKQREGKLEEAKDLYKQVIRKEPRHLQALNNLGVVYLKLKRYKWAIIRFNDALDVKHDYVDAHYNLACLYAQKNDTKRSLFYLKNAIDINPEVRQWASGDDDLKSLAGLPEFNKILQARDN